MTGLAAAGCGGSTRTTPSAGSAVAFSQCMRGNGVARFPDPGSGGTIPKVGPQQLGVAVARFASAETACRHLLPNGGGGPSAAELQRSRALALRFARCMRANGVGRFPDPAGDGRIPDPASVGLDQGSPRFQRANDACRASRPPYLPSNAAYDAWARTHA